MASPAQSALFAMQDLFGVVAQSVATFGSANAAVEWFETANPALNDKTPFEEFAENGPAKVEALIGRIEHGIYS